MQTDIFQRIENAGKADFGDILSKSFNLFKDVWVDGLTHVLLTMIAVIPFLLVVYIPILPIYIDMFSYGYDPYYYEPSVDFSALFWIGYIFMVLILSFVMQVVTYVITAHFYKVCQKKDTGSPEDVGGFFVFLKGNFTKLLLLSLATFGIAILAALACYLPIFYVMVPLQLMLPIFAFNPKLSVSDIIKAGFKLGNKYWLIVFGLIIVSSLIAQLGIILCIVGVLVTAYFVHLPMYFFYKDTVGFDESPQNWDAPSVVE